MVHLYNPVIEYLIVAPSDQSLAPEKNNTLELGAKVKVLRRTPRPLRARCSIR